MAGGTSVENTKDSLKDIVADTVLPPLIAPELPTLQTSRNVSKLHCNLFRPLSVEHSVTFSWKHSVQHWSSTILRTCCLTLL